MNIALVGLAYLIGAIPFSILVARTHGVDLRTVGSGNPGATNVARAIGMRWGLFVLLLDALKGFVPTMVFPAWADSTSLGFQWSPALTTVLVGGATVVGHVFPVYLGFRGGKGAATGLGACLAMVPGPTGVAAGVFAITMVTTRFVSLGSMLAAIALPIAFYFLAPETATTNGRPILIGLIALAGLIVLRHRTNITRLIAGTEARLTRKSPPVETRDP